MKYLNYLFCAVSCLIMSVSYADKTHKQKINESKNKKAGVKAPQSSSKRSTPFF